MENSIVELYKSGMSLKQVSFIVGKTSHFVYNVIKKAGICRGKYESRTGKKLSEEHKKRISDGLQNSSVKIGCYRKQLKDGFETITPELAYIIGVLFGDGYFCKSGIGLEVIDKDFVTEFARCIEVHFGLKSNIYFKQKENLKDWRNGKSYVRNPTYLLRCNSANLREFLLKINNYEWINNLPFSLKIFVLRGLWDSEGNSSNISGQVRFYSKDIKNIELYESLLKELLNIDAKHYKNSYCMYISQFGQRSQVENFFKIINPSNKRKISIDYINQC